MKRPTLQFCRDCRYRMGDECQQPTLVTVDLVTGESSFKSCREQRYGGDCGPGGAYFWGPKTAKEDRPVDREMARQDTAEWPSISLDADHEEPMTCTPTAP